MTESRDTETRSDGRTRPDERTRTDAPTLKDVDHTHPETGRTFGGNFTFARGGVIAADGGRPDVMPENVEHSPGDKGDGQDEPETLEDVEHTPPNDSEDANRVFERGEEARKEDRTATVDVTENGTEAATTVEDRTEAVNTVEDRTEAATAAEDVGEDE